MPVDNFEPSCFFTGFNGPVDPRYVLASQTANSSDPLTLNQAKKRPDWQQWEDAIQTEVQSLKDFQTFEVCVLPPGKRLVGCKYVFKLKLLPSGEIERHRIRLVAQGFSQQEGVDYNEVFAPFVDSTSISLLLAIANQND